MLCCLPLWRGLRGGRPGPPPPPVAPARREIITVRGQSYVSRLPKYWPLPRPLSTLRVCTHTPQQRWGVYTVQCTHSPGGEGGVGVSIFWKTRDIGLPSYINNLSTLLLLLLLLAHLTSGLVLRVLQVLEQGRPAPQLVLEVNFNRSTWILRRTGRLYTIVWNYPFQGFRMVHDLVRLSHSGFLSTISWNYPCQGFCARSCETVPFRTCTRSCEIILSRAFAHDLVRLSLSGHLYTILWDYPFQACCTRSREIIPSRAFEHDLVRLSLSELLNTIL